MMDDSSRRAYYDIHRKSVFVAYLLWIPGFGLNHFYSNNLVQAIFQLVLTASVVTWFTVLVQASNRLIDPTDLQWQSLGGAAALLLLWKLIDMFKIPSYIGRHNRRVRTATGMREYSDDW